MIGKIYKYFIKVSWQEKKLVTTAFVYAMAVRFLMKYVKFKRYEKYLGSRLSEHSDAYPEKDNDTIRLVRRVVLSVSKNTPWESKCMVQAVACLWILRRYGIKSNLYLGIKKDPEDASKLKAHAWLKIGEIPITGAPQHRSYKTVNYYAS